MNILLPLKNMSSVNNTTVNRPSVSCFIALGEDISEKG